MTNRFGGIPVERVNRFGGVPTQSNRFGGVPTAPVETEENGPIDYLREFAQGPTFGGGDELEALFRSGLDTLQTGSSFDDNLSMYFKDINKERGAFKKESPKTAMGLELAGGLMAGAPISKAVGIGTTKASAMLRQGAVGAGGGATYGFLSGGSDDDLKSSEGVMNRLESAGFGAVLGAPLGAVGGLAGHYLAPIKYKGKSFETPEQFKKYTQKLDPDEAYELVEMRMYQKALATKLKGAKGEAPPLPPAMTLAKEVSDELGLDINTVQKAANKRGGFTDFNTIGVKELQEGAIGLLRRTDEEAEKAANRSARHGFKFLADNAFSPIKRLMTVQVSPRYAKAHNRAQNRALMQLGKHNDTVKSRVEKVRNYLDEQTPESLGLQRLMLNAAMGDSGAFDDAVRHVAERFGWKEAKAFKKYYKAAETWAGRYHMSVNSMAPVSKGWLHTQKRGQRPEGQLSPDLSPNTFVDVSEKMRTRKIFGEDQLDEVAQYENPLRTMDDWIDEHAASINVAEVMHLRPAGRVDMVRIPNKEKLGPKKLAEKKAKILKKDQKALEFGQRGGYVGRAIAEKLKSEGYDDVSIYNAVELAHNVLYDAQRSPAAILRAAKDLGYAFSIFNPYGAALNVVDMFNAASTMGMRNAMTALFKKSELSAADMGLVNQYMGEYNKQVSNLSKTKLEKLLGWTPWIAEKSAKWGGFRRLDAFGKEKIAQMALEEARKAVKKGDFEKQWQYTFTKDEMHQLKNDLMNGKNSDLVKELAMFRLSDVQPINAAQTARFALQNPNARIFYMLKNYAIRQLDFLRTNSVDAWKKGEKAKAANFAMRYALYTGGGYAVVDEARQPLKWEEPDFSPENLAEKAGRQMVTVATGGIAGSNDYAWEKFWDNPATAFMEGILPPVIPLEALWKDMAGLADGEPPTEMLKNLPVVGKVFFKPLLES